MNKTNFPDNVTRMWNDPRFKILIEVDKLLNGSRVWGGMKWEYQSIHPVKYRPVAEKIRKALDDLKNEYGIKE
jgi:hypothetical protein